MSSENYTKLLGRSAAAFAFFGVTMAVANHVDWENIAIFFFFASVLSWGVFMFAMIALIGRATNEYFRQLFIQIGKLFRPRK